MGDVDGAISLLADYVDVFFSGCDAVAYSSSGASEVVPGGSQIHIDMADSPSTTVISQGILVAPTVVQCQYISG
jgi:hypothetical protein